MGKINTKKYKINNNIILSNSDNSDNSDNSRHFLTAKNINKLIYQGGKYYRKNDNLINKQAKRTKNNLNIRTLDNLKHYGYITNIQSGGFIIDYIKIKYKLRQTKKFITKFRKEEKKIQKYLDSYKGKTTSFKDLADKKALEVTKYIVDYRQKTIYEFVLNNIEFEKTIKTSEVENTIKLIDSRIKGIEASLKTYNKEKSKEIPSFIKYNKAFQKDSKSFLKLIDYFETNLRGFFRTIQKIKDDYLLYEGKTKVDKEAKDKVKKYKRFSKDIDYMLSFRDEEIKKMVDIKSEIDTILDTGKDYTEKYESMAKENYVNDLELWRDNYKSIYENIKSLDEEIDVFIKYFEDIENNLNSIFNQLVVLYVKDKNPSATKNIQNNAIEMQRNFSIYLKLFKTIKNAMIAIKTSLLKEESVVDLDATLLYSEGSYKAIQDDINKSKDFIGKDIFNINLFFQNKNKSMPGGNYEGLENNMSGGAAGPSASRSVLRASTRTGAPRPGAPRQPIDTDTLADGGIGTLTYKDFLDLTFDKLEERVVKCLTVFNKEEQKYTKYAYYRIKALLNIVLFFMYYDTRDDNNCASSKALNEIDMNQKILLDLIKLIIIYNIYNIKHNITTMPTEPYNFTTKIKKNITDLYINVEPNIHQFLSNKRISIKLKITGTKSLKYLVCSNIGSGNSYDYNTNKGKSNLDNFSTLIINAYKTGKNTTKLFDFNINELEKNTFVKYFEANDKQLFESTLNQYTILNNDNDFINLLCDEILEISNDTYDVKRLLNLDEDFIASEVLVRRQSLVSSSTSSSSSTLSLTTSTDITLIPASDFKHMTVAQAQNLTNTQAKNLTAAQINEIPIIILNKIPKNIVDHINNSIIATLITSHKTALNAICNPSSGGPGSGGPLGGPLVGAPGGLGGQGGLLVAPVVLGAAPVVLGASSSTSSTAGTSLFGAPGAKTSTGYKDSFIIDINKVDKTSPNIDVNLNNIKQHMETIVNIISDNLQADSYNSITEKINKITENINNLKLIEPKFLDTKIKTYDKVIMKYDWLRDYVKKEGATVHLKEADEITNLMKQTKQIGSLVIKPTTNVITDTEINKIIILALSNKSPSIPADNDMLKKLNDAANAKKFIEEVKKSGNNILQILKYVSSNTNVDQSIRTERDVYQQGQPQGQQGRQQQGQQRRTH